MCLVGTKFITGLRQSEAFPIRYRVQAVEDLFDPVPCHRPSCLFGFEVGETGALLSKILERVPFPKREVGT